MDKYKEILSNFGFDENAWIVPWGNGHINDTFRVNDKFLLQKVNTGVFKDYEGLMNNIMLVTTFLQKQAFASGGDVLREAMGVMPTVQGKSFYLTPEGEVYRVYIFVNDSLSLDAAESADDLYNCGKAFGTFQRKLSAFDASLLVETIPGFHHTLNRFKAFEEAIENNISGKKELALPEINGYLSRYDEIKGIWDTYSRLPLRVTHNDTKLNNILFDSVTREPICVVDLDTVMPGYAANDFGDSLRFGASTASEDEQDLSKVHFDMTLYKAYAKGFIEGCGGGLTEEELLTLPYGAIMMTFECGMRFLTDHLNGDTYFKIHRENHNLDRCRTQLKLVEEMEQALPQMIEYIKEIM